MWCSSLFHNWNLSSMSFGARSSHFFPAFHSCCIKILIYSKAEAYQPSTSKVLAPAEEMTRLVAGPSGRSGVAMWNSSIAVAQCTPKVFRLLAGSEIVRSANSRICSGIYWRTFAELLLHFLSNILPSASSWQSSCCSFRASPGLSAPDRQSST